MQISEIEFIPVKPKSGLIGFVSFVLDDSLYCGSIAVYTRPGGGMRLVWPKINNKGIQYPTSYPIKKELADEIEKAVEEKVIEILTLGEKMYGQKTEQKLQQNSY